MHLAILIPTYHRHDRLKKLVDNIHLSTNCPHTIYFVVEPEDKASIKEAKSLNEKHIINKSPHTYVSAINTGFKSTQEEYVFCGSDDIVFSQNWDVPIMKAFDDKRIGIAGSTDSWPINQTGCHASHFTVSRAYIEKFGGVQDEKNTIYSSSYRHYHCDVETLHTAMHRGSFVQCPTSFIEHNHYFNKTAEMDETYKRAKLLVSQDNQTFESRRRSFEYWHYGYLWQGKKYRVNKGKLSIVIASYNVLPYLKNTISSLYDNTYHDFELIIVDNASDPETLEFLHAIEEYCTVIYNERQEYVTHAWNQGIKASTGDYICVLNNDVKLTENWDIPLINALDDMVWVASPYMTDAIDRSPFANVERFNNIQLAGPCFMVARDTYEKIGLFPETTRIWYNDYWLSWVVTKVFEKKAKFIREVVIHHYKSQSTATLSEIRRSEFVRIINEDKEAFNKIRIAWEQDKKIIHTPIQ